MAPTKPDKLTAQETKMLEALREIESRKVRNQLAALVRSIAHTQKKPKKRGK